MRIFIIVLLLIAVVAGLAAAFLIVTTPRSPAGIAVPLTPAQLELAGTAPADADLVALVPTAAAVYAKLRANAITGDAIETWTKDRELPRPWMVGSADLVLWRTPAGTTYGFRLDALRALLVRTYLAFSGGDVHVEGRTFYFGPPPAGPRLGSEIEAILRRGEGLRGDALVVQRDDGRAFPPIGRPAVSAVTVSEGEATIVSRAPSDTPAAAPQHRVTLARGPLLSAWFGEPPRIVRDLDRLLPGDISALLGDGGSMVLYDVESGGLLPRPHGLFVVRDTAESRVAAARLTTLAELVGEIAYEGDRILVSVDRASLPTYRKEEMAELPFPATSWAMRIDADRMVPVLERLGDNRGLRYAAPRIHRSVRDLRSWIRHLSRADLIEAAVTTGGGREELRVRITAK